MRASTGTVWHFTKEDFFTKAYLLNRFLVHLIRACIGPQSAFWPGKMKYRYESERVAVASWRWRRRFRVKVTASYDEDPRTVTTFEFDQVAVRYGVEEDSVPGRQMIKLDDADDGHRTSLAQAAVHDRFLGLQGIMATLIATGYRSTVAPSIARSSTVQNAVA